MLGRYACIALLGTLLGACSLLPPAADCAGLPGGGHYCLQAATALNAFSAVQIASLQVGQGVPQRMVISLEADGKSLRVAGLTPFGQKLFTLDYAEKDVHYETVSGLEGHFDPLLFVALLQWVMWPEKSVANGLSASLRVQEQAGHRRIYRGETLLIDIERRGELAPYEHVHVTIPARQIELEIDTLEPAETRP